MENVTMIPVTSRSTVILTANALRNLADTLAADDCDVGVRARTRMSVALRNHAFDLMDAMSKFPVANNDNT